MNSSFMEMWVTSPGQTSYFFTSCTGSEPGTFEYAISRDHDEPNHFFVFERYSGREAFDKHCASQEYQNLLNSRVMVGLPQPKVLKQLKPN
ncbi:uncharacterized protein Z519_07751 [Cladophialophora bantiana CBS 173.52]|uniref:ABM domain-containing protein n=1 Tax=Cladophialophora bantiana (strain ATCC 10958 / CBS 173.52 / CDC B-1940 / NIH 8579) TaxID=1442370 RepID=A0A0D2EP66_CLAB1|nr:uncharacterized protein Z519_07751 [Cladophialophora bantiana CBS 173.52]KIW91781.1 hypothetical protein Z519_07751 [Cladophialophora bantiana CBS 173.52]